MKIKCYHGTNANFENFSADQTGITSGNRGFLGTGFYFSLDKEKAQAYGTLIPCEVTLEKPFILDKPLSDEDAEFWSTITYAPFDAGMTPDEVYNGLSYTIPDDPELADDIRNGLESNGYDGIVFKGDKSGSEIVAFYPNQIQKLHIKEVGNFNVPKESLLTGIEGQSQSYKRQLYFFIHNGESYGMFIEYQQSMGVPKRNDDGQTKFTRTTLKIIDIGFGRCSPEGEERKDPVNWDYQLTDKHDAFYVLSIVKNTLLNFLTEHTNVTSISIYALSNKRLQVYSHLDKVLAPLAFDMEVKTTSPDEIGEYLFFKKRIKEDTMGIIQFREYFLNKVEDNYGRTNIMMDPSPEEILLAWKASGEAGVKFIADSQEKKFILFPGNKHGHVDVTYLLNIPYNVNSRYYYGSSETRPMAGKLMDVSNYLYFDYVHGIETSDEVIKAFVGLYNQDWSWMEEYVDIQDFMKHRAEMQGLLKKIINKKKSSKTEDSKPSYKRRPMLNYNFMEDIEGEDALVLDKTDHETHKTLPQPPLGESTESSTGEIEEDDSDSFKQRITMTLLM